MFYIFKYLKVLLRIILLLFLILLPFFIAYFLWQPGLSVNDGRYDLRMNAIWVQHGWLGNDNWFKKVRRDATTFRNIDNIRKLAKRLSSSNIYYIYPHLCPTSKDGQLPEVDEAQVRLFLRELSSFAVLPWVGGVLGKHCSPSSKEWKASFISSILKLLNTYPELKGIHVNIEPMPSGDEDFIALLKELKEAIPKNKVLSVATYPPPTIWHRFPNVHWGKEYYRKISSIADQMVVMMYDTSITNYKLYQWLMSEWTEEIIRWTSESSILLGVPAYEDKGVGYHNPVVENLRNAILGINAGLGKFDHLPNNYKGLSIYCEWEMNSDKWNILSSCFLRKNPE